MDNMTSPSGGSSTGARSPEENFRIVRRRNRIPLSCLPCRTRKLKCDRNHPCANCVKREGSDTSKCTYAAPARKKGSQLGNGQAPTPDDMQNRIDRLENLVLTLMQGGTTVSQGPSPETGPGPSPPSARASASGPSTSSPTDSGKTDQEVQGTPDTGAEDSDTDEGLAKSLGVLKVDFDRGKSMYIGNQHWHTILSDLTEVKNYFQFHKKDLEQSYQNVLNSQPTTARDGPTLLLGAAHTSDGDLRAELPPKSTVMTLCNRYFNSMDHAVNIIHAPTFHKQLQAHWQDPSKTPLMWLGLLYSILCLAMLSYHKIGDEPPEWKTRSLELAAEYRLRTVQCLVTADYTKPTDYTIETMMLYVFGEHSSRWDAEFGLWLIGGIVAKVAMRMGYHRDAKNFPNLTPFQAEMRRRVWAMVRMLDISFSHFVSLPTMIDDDDCDTQLPSNIFDEEFGPDIRVLPPSRPQSEATPISYMITKLKLCIGLNRVLKTTGKVGKPAPYDDILRLDAEIQKLKKEMPDHLQFKPLEGCRDPINIILARCTMEILNQKMVCLLHRGYMARARTNMRYALSRRRAIGSAMECLNYLCVFDRESQPNGRLASLRWHICSSGTKDFFLPAMMLADELHWHLHRRQATPQGNHPEIASFWLQSEVAEMIARLERTREIWKAFSDGSVEAFKAYNIMGIMLDQIKPAASQARSTPGLVSMQQVDSKNVKMQDYTPDEMAPEQSAAMTLGMLSTGVPPTSSTITSNTNSGFMSDSSSMFSGMSSTQNPATTTATLEEGANPMLSLGSSSDDFMGDFDPLSSSGFGMNGFGANNGAMTPTTMFNNLAETMDLNAGFDWGTVANFAQSANWGPGPDFQYFSGAPDQEQQE